MPMLDTTNDSLGITGKLITDMVLGLLSYVAQIEREKIKSRQEAGIAIKKAKDKELIESLGYDAARDKLTYKGRAPVERPAEWHEVRQLVNNGIITNRQAMERLKLTRTSYYKLVNGDKQAFIDAQKISIGKMAV